MSVSFGDRQVLKGIHGDVKRGQALLVVGPSGCGKSTWALLAAGLIPGTVEAHVEGRVWRHPSLARPGAIGYVFQDPESQFCQIRVGEEIAFGLENMGVDPVLMDARIQAALNDAGLDADREMEHHTLSGGNKQKLALAAALALHPEMLILDEPTANLDPAATAAVFDQIERLIDEGTTVVVIEHKFGELVERIPTMLLFNRDGTIHRVGPTAAVMAEERAWFIDQGLIEADAVKQPVSSAAVSNGTSAIELVGVAARYHRRAPWVLEDLSLTVQPGELVALVGPNGAGKSTVLKVMAGLMKPQSGIVRRPPSAQTGFGFQNPEHQFIFERVVDELANRYVEGSVPADVQTLLDEFHLSGHEHESPYSLSQGQKRRLSVAVMVQRPRRLYCLDEPTFGQDARTRRIIMERLEERRVHGAAVVISTHDMDLVRRYATRVVAISAGRVIFDGAPQALMQNLDVLRAARLAPGQESQPEAVHPERPAVFAAWTGRTRSSLLGRLNPAWKLVAVFIAVGLGASAGTLRQAIPLAVLPVALMLFFSGLGVVGTARRILPFAIFFAIYVWMMTAYAAVGPNTSVVHVLWYRLSFPGFMKGLVLGTRMLAAVAFGILFVSTVDLVDLVKSLSRQFRVPPKFSYGTLAGLSFFPQFREEWQKLRLARRVRGKDARFSFIRVVTYALPLLSDAVRLSERVAIAMEARGFVGRVTEASDARSYYRASPSGWRDALFLVVVVGLTAAALWH
ncbi:ATP-binding cassette domain-containing protein [Sulfobacillus sp. DSM 109850]|uniref:ATP-binding cassette domain-containing protein n=1 Tax=Sulfobacillus harzensis TaxID=2729629 RepID=A0A7Y0L0T1_9FIRM|nr:ATP-binding cassette domain-containing protein [Sulfobacillus harzensis]